jgi:hypothetical protein
MACTINSTWILPECFDVLRINAGLTPDTAITYAIKGDSGREYQIASVTDTEGAILVYAALFPDGYFNSGRGYFVLKLMNLDDPCEVIPMTICAETVDNVVMRFRKSGNPVIQIQVG